MTEWKRGALALAVIVVLLVGTALAGEILVERPGEAPSSAEKPQVTVSTVRDLENLARTDLTQLDDGDVDLDANALTRDVNRRLGVVGARIRSLPQDYTVPSVGNRAGTATTGGGTVKKAAAERHEARHPEPQRGQ